MCVNVLKDFINIIIDFELEYFVLFELPFLCWAQPCCKSLRILLKKCPKTVYMANYTFLKQTIYYLIINNIISDRVWKFSANLV